MSQRTTVTKYQDPRNGNWYLNYYNEHGKRVRKSLGALVRTEEEAETQRLQKELGLRTGLDPSSSPTSPNVPRFEDFARDYLRWHTSRYPASHRNGRIYGIFDQYLLPVFGPEPLDGIGNLHVEMYISARLEQRAAAGTITKEIDQLLALLHRAVSWKKIVSMPVDTKEIVIPDEAEDKPPPFYTRADLARLYEVSMIYRYVWQFIVNTGLRRAEAMNLRLDQIKPDWVDIVSSGRHGGQRTKSGKWRRVPLNAAAKEALSVLRARDESAPYLLPRMQPRSFSRAFEKDIRRAGLDGTIHWLRHTFCSHLVMGGVQLRTVQVLAGHSRIEVTERYAHLEPDYMHRSVEAISL